MDKPESTMQVITYHKWHTKHHKWLNALMWHAIEEKKALEPPYILNLWYLVQSDPDHNFNLEPRRQFVRQYELYIVVAEATNPVEGYQQLLIEWFAGNR